MLLPAALLAAALAVTAAAVFAAPLAWLLGLSVLPLKYAALALITAVLGAAVTFKGP
jgi:hypothetical protein